MQPVEEWGSGNVTGTVDESGHCVCKVYLPDTTFPADRVDIVQITSNKLIADLEIHINKVHFIPHSDAFLSFRTWIEIKCNMFFSSSQVNYIKSELVILLSELTNLTIRVGILESRPDKYVKLEFDLLRVELREFESLVTHLKTSLNSSSPIFDSLYNEVSGDQIKISDTSGFVLIISINLGFISLSWINLERRQL